MGSNRESIENERPLLADCCLSLTAAKYIKQTFFSFL